MAELEKALTRERPLLNGVWRATEIKSDGGAPKKLEWIMAAGHLMTFIDGTVHGGEVAQSHDSKNHLLCYKRDTDKGDFRFRYEFVDDDTLRVTVTRGGQKPDYAKYLVGDVGEKAIVTLRRIAATEQK
ncbi:MAG: hypothetical protein ACJ8F7_09465 [Gemmataceae bacterium]